ncbi:MULTISPECIES: hypothetical protein [unclassified Rickettsia]|uniref:hypothetical protein n=1 Tax=unclassified Rickettsia TaxID=114295 RepID=UPI003132FD48
MKKIINPESNPKSINDQIAKLAVQDTVLLICELLNNNTSDIISCTRNFKVSIEVTTDDIKYIEVIGNTVLSNSIFDE